MLDYVLGIDPGATGALALYDVTNGRILKLWDMPNTAMILTTGKKTNRVDIYALLLIFELAVDTAQEAEATLHIHLEKVQAFSKQSAPASFNFGAAAMVPQVLAVALGYEPVMIPPQTWKRQIGLQASAKDEARLLALRLFPNLASALKRKLDVDRADAILIAMYKP